MTQPEQAPTGTLDLTVQGSMMTGSFVPPKVRVNGALVASDYGRRPITVYAGPTRIDVECEWMWKYGRASLQVDVQPGQTVPVFYAMPYSTWSPGRIGHEPQKRAGLVSLLLFIGVLIGLPVLIVLLVSLA